LSTKIFQQKQATNENSLIGVTEILSLFVKNTQPLYLFLNQVVGPLSVYVWSLNRTFLLVG